MMKKDDYSVRSAVARIAGVDPDSVTCVEEHGSVIVNFPVSMKMTERWPAIEQAVAAIVGHDRISIT
jgi:hypothetical protein